MPLLARYRERIEEGGLKPDAAQERSVEILQRLVDQLQASRKKFFFAKQRQKPNGLYLWGDVGRGKSMLMDLFFEAAPVSPKKRIHFNAFMMQTHARIHAERQRGGSSDPIPAVAKMVADEAQLLCFDEFQVTDIADAMVLGRLFEQLLGRGITIVATSNTPPSKLYEGGLNRQLFQPFIAMIEKTLTIAELNSSRDYRLGRAAEGESYLTPLSRETDKKMDRLWREIEEGAEEAPHTLHVFGRELVVKRSAGGAARFAFADLCETPLAGADYLAIAHAFHTVMIDHIPLLSPAKRNEARRFVLLIDTLYDEGIRLVCSAQALPDELYPEGDGAEAFRRTASRLNEMRSADYRERTSSAVRSGA